MMLTIGAAGARGDFVSQEEVDLIVVQDHARSEEICKALKHAGIHHVEFWPEGMLFSNPWGPRHRPFHIRVREEDLAQAQLVLSSTGLTGS
jgi:hypothetical protein